jgi:hypothetical protein
VVGALGSGRAAPLLQSVLSEGVILRRNGQGGGGGRQDKYGNEKKKMTTKSRCTRRNSQDESVAHARASTVVEVSGGNTGTMASARVR